MTKLFLSFKIRPLFFLVLFPMVYSYVFYAMPRLTAFDNSLYITIPLIFFAISIEYSALPMKHKSKTFFYKHGLARTIHDYFFLQKLLIVLIVLTIIFNVITRTWFTTNLDWENYLLSPEYHFNSFTTGLAMMTMSTSGRYGVSFIRKNTKYHLAKICFQLCSDESDELKQKQFLQKGVDFYNQFIKRKSNLKIQNTGPIYSKFISFSTSEKKTKIKSIIKSFDKELELEPFKQLKKTFDIQDESIKESKIVDDLKRILLILIGAIAGATTILLNIGGITEGINSIFSL